jgi:predicted transcriptional regulator
MAEIVTLELPETLAQRAKEIAALTNRRLEDVLVEWIDRASTEFPSQAESKAKIKEGTEAPERGEVIDGEEVLAELEEDIQRTATNANIPQGRGWPPGFFEETFGAFQDDPLVIDSEGIFEDEEEFN